MTSRLERLWSLSGRLELEHIEAVRHHAVADLRAALRAVRDEIARQSPRMGFGDDSLSREDDASTKSSRELASSRAAGRPE